MQTTRQFVRRGLALAGAIEAIWFLGASLVLGLARTGYDPTHDPISRLGEQGSDMPLIWNVGGFGVSAALYALYAVAIGDEFGRRWLFGATALQALTLAGGAVFSCDHGCPAATTSTPGALHTVFGLSYFAVTALAPLIGALTFRRRERWRRISALSYTVSVLLLALFAVGPLFGAEHHGLWQRLFLVPALAWQAGVSLRLHRLRVRPLEPATPGAIPDPTRSSSTSGARPGNNRD